MINKVPAYVAEHLDIRRETITKNAKCFCNRHYSMYCRNDVMRALFRVIVHVLTVVLLVKIITRYTGDRSGILATH